MRGIVRRWVKTHKPLLGVIDAYKCLMCGESVAVNADSRTFSKPPPLECPTCGASDMQAGRYYSTVVASSRTGRRRGVPESVAADPAESLTLDDRARKRAADALGDTFEHGRAHYCAEHDQGDGCTICWSVAADVIRAAEGLRLCPSCGGGGMVAPAACCPTCGGSGLVPLEATTGGAPLPGRRAEVERLRDAIRDHKRRIEDAGPVYVLPGSVSAAEAKHRTDAALWALVNMDSEPESA